MAISKILLSDNVTELTGVKSVVYKEVTSADVNIHGGCVCSASIEVEVYGSQATAVSAGDVVYYYQYDKNNTATLVGIFNCEPVIETKTSYKFVAYDNAQKLKADFSQWLQANQSNFPKTVKQLVQQACTIAGVTLGSSSWGLSSQSVQAFYAEGITCRDILSYAAEIGCCFVRCHTDGNIYFDWFSSNANTIAPSVGTGQYAYKQDGLNYANYTTAALDRVAVHPSGEDDVAYIYPTGITSGNTLHIQNNLLLTGANAAFYNAVAQNVYTVMSALGTYRPMTASLFAKENPFRAGDIVSVTDAQSVTFTSIITGMTVSNSGAVLESVGNETYGEGTGNTQKAITQLASDVVRINKLKVDWADINTAIINYLTANNVTAQNLTIVDENGNVLATYDSSGITLGNSGEVHAEIDFNSFQLYDKDGNLYASIGDARDASGLADVTCTQVADGINSTYNIRPTANDPSAIVVSVNGTVLTSGYTASTSQITFSAGSKPSNGDVIVATYKTSNPFYQYLFGTLQSGTELGYYAFASGVNSTATGYASSVLGGVSNSATGSESVICGGNSNTASGDQSAIIGGRNNYARGYGAVVIGGGSWNYADGNSAIVSGYQNHATGDMTAVLGGASNYATKSNSAVVGGQMNNATGNASAVIGGYGNESNHKSQVVFGEYNIADPSTADSNSRGNYVEIVGNGTGIGSKSNARTLDWDGNEVLSGTLKTGSDVIIKSSDRYKDIVLKQNDASNGNCGFIRMDAGNVTNQTVNRFNFYEYSPKSTADPANTGYYEIYTLPAPTKGLSANPSAYNILTSKSAVTIAQGGTGQTGIINETVVANIISAASGFSITQASYSQWGKLASVYLIAKRTGASITTNSDITIGTIVSGKRPKVTSMGMILLPTSNFTRITSGGSLVTYGQWSQNTSCDIMCTFLLQ